jgi:hypothetical protein
VLWPPWTGSGRSMRQIRFQGPHGSELERDSWIWRARFWLVWEGVLAWVVSWANAQACSPGSSPRGGTSLATRESPAESIIERTRSLASWRRGLR